MTVFPTLNEVRGSRLRCLLLTGLPREVAARTLTDLTDGNALITDADEWMPKGILQWDEAKVHEKFPLIDSAQRQELLDWWLHTKPHANTPNWDIVSTCTIEQKQRLLLVEAKAHWQELSNNGKSPGNQANNVGEMGKGAFATQADWKDCVLKHALPFVPQSAWGQRLNIGGVPLFPLIRSLELGFM